MTEQRNEPMENNLFEKLFFEQPYIPIALYKTAAPAEKLNASSLIYLSINTAYEKVNNVRKDEVIGRSFQEVWPNTEACWHEIIVRCLREKKVVHVKSESLNTEKYLEVIAFPLGDELAATIFIDRTELRESEAKLKLNQKKLLESRSMLRELATKLTISEETTRREIATDLHDSIGHSLLSLLLDLRALKEEPAGPESETVLSRSLESVEKMIAESRQLIFQLSPPILLEVGITPALEALADNMLTPRGIKWNVTTRGQVRDYSADDAVCILLYRLSRELLVNVVKHARATSVHLSVNRGPGKIQIVIEDNGIGMKKLFTPGKRGADGIGLFSISERLEHIGGELQLISNSQGTTVSLLAPLKLPVGENIHSAETENLL